MWITSAIDVSEHHVLVATYDLCIPSGNLRTSVLLQMMTGAFGIIAFSLACILIHIAVMLNAHINTDKDQSLDDGDIFELDDWRKCYTEPYKNSKVRHI